MTRWRRAAWLGFAAAAVSRLAASGAEIEGRPAGPGAGAVEMPMEELVVRPWPRSSAASSAEIGAGDFELRPHSTIFEILRAVPGLVAVQHQGGGKAPQWLIRGFDADHGTDLAVFVDGLPVNLVSHAHGQGYADTAFLIPETVERLELFKGPYVPQFGDFATAGVLNFVTRDEVPEDFFLAEGGSFETQRYAFAVSPGREASPRAKRLLAGQARFQDGPFQQPENFAGYNLFGKLSLEEGPGSRLSLSAGGYAGDWDASGQIPLREVHAGRIDRFGSVDPTEGGRSDRENVNLRYEIAGSGGDRWSLQLYGSRYALRLFSDFTFFRDTGLRFVRDPDGTVRDTRDGPIEPGADYVPGDGILQVDSRILYGARAGYARHDTAAGIPVETEVGLENRNDRARVALRRQVRRRPFFSVNDVRIAERSFGGYVQHRILLGERVRLEAGLRGDAFWFDVEDRLPAQLEDPNFDPQPIDGRVADSILSPKAGLVASPFGEATELYANFGLGFHSNDARNAVLSEGERGFSPLVRATGWEVGARTQRFERLDLAVAFWFLDLDSELVFSSDAGRQETGAGGSLVPSPATRRFGIDFAARLALGERLYADSDLSWAHARFRSSGDPIPLAPTLVVNGGLSAEPLPGLSVGIRARFLDDRPATEDRALVARGAFLLDGVARYRWKRYEASVVLRNLADREFREAQFADTTCVRHELDAVPGCRARPGKQGSSPEEPPPDLHFTPGEPLAVLAGLTVRF